MAAPPATPALPITRVRYLMGALCEITVTGTSGPQATRQKDVEAAVEAAFEEIARLESILSDWIPTSELSRLNRRRQGETVRCSPDLFDFLTKAARLSEQTGGAFDITVGPLIRAWDIRGAGRVPAEEELAAALGAVGWQRLLLDDASRSAHLTRAGMTLDPGGIGKGYALDAAARVLADRDVTSALLDFSGQILVIGKPPDAPHWTVSLAHPSLRDERICDIALPEGSIATSSNAERAPAGGGHGHILDPASGQPVSWRGSVSVLARTGTEADAWSTALFVLGPEKGLSLVAATTPGGILSAIFLEPRENGDPRVLASEGVHCETNTEVDHSPSLLKGMKQ